MNKARTDKRPRPLDRRFRAERRLDRYWEEQNWDGHLYDGHPDWAAKGAEYLCAYLGISRSDLTVENCPRHGRGFVLPDGDWIFPGHSHVTRIITEE